MRKLAIVTVATAALVLSGILAWTADATTLTSAAAVHPEANSSLVGKAGCWLPGADRGDDGSQSRGALARYVSPGLRPAALRVCAGGRPLPLCRAGIQCR